ncbi:mercuric reductase [Gimesia panareensis]|uniref:Mercuric reductase n=1 Tax=Gimesia panareensis TaxID=2527978 RepID=A0A518AC62_9PLAN|nr:mercuric reductase [Gimesia panareensis]QDU52306.1 Mercuric reductase [Gimesia panareensis]QDV20594.1 Mercuric reductase [Gimesia panareensis]
MKTNGNRNQATTLTGASNIIHATDSDTLKPDDQYNQQLVSNVHPADWKNPVSNQTYDLVVIGAGTAGLVTAAGAAGLGAKVALIEKHFMGGDCLNVGCVPSKALISAARVAATTRRAAEYGVVIDGDVQVDFEYVMERMRRMRAQISPHDSVKRFTGLGIDVYLGNGSFNSDGKSIRVHDQKLKYKKAVICTGARAVAPPVPGLEAVGYLTNESLFSLTKLPKRLAVIGGGPIGCEMAQSFARFGSRVHLIESGPRILGRDDEDAATIVAGVFTEEGIEVSVNASIQQITVATNGKRIQVTSNGNHIDIEVDEILVAAGRAPNVEGLNLSAVNVDYDKSGVKVNDHLRTANPKIFAAGDICFPYKFTHSADFLARIVIQNALFFGRAKASHLLIPWSTYTSPEVAHVGLLPAQAESQGIKIQTFIQEMKDVDRALLEGEESGFVKVHVKAGSDKIVGATVVGQHAGDLVSEITVAMNNGIGLKGIGSTIHPYPTQAEAIRKLGDQFNRTRLTPFTKKLLKLLIRLH